MPDFLLLFYGVFMGFDASIYFKIADCVNDGDIYVSGWSIQPAGEFDREFGATHEVDNSMRFYDFGYERGDWPAISSILLILLSSDQVDTVWYDSDGFGDAPLVMDKDRLLKITAHYIDNGHKPYCNRAACS